MRQIARILVVLVALFNILMGLNFLFNPAGAAANFALTPEGTQGLATLRADFSAFFLTGGLFALVGAVRTRADLLMVPLTLLSIAIVGRAIGLVMDGAPQTAYPPMVVEAVMIAILLLARRQFGRAPA